MRVIHGISSLNTITQDEYYLICSYIAINISIVFITQYFNHGLLQRPMGSINIGENEAVPYGAEGNTVY